jgi:catechol 2,3-dioxygenase-like lactoylglutathione lyase family enzyme
VTKLRHLAIAADDPDATARFYVDAFQFERVRELRAEWGYGHVLTDGTISLSVLRYTADAAAGAERGTAFVGLHHIGFEVDDLAAFAKRVEAAGATTRHDISDALRIPLDAAIKEYQGPDGVVFDLGGPGVWSRDMEV